RSKNRHIARDSKGNLVFMAETRAWLQMVQDNYPDIAFHFTSEFYKGSLSSFFYDNAGGSGGVPTGLELSSGKGINSWLSVGGKRILPAFQSSFACSIRSIRDETKFHQINRSPKGSPPRNIKVEDSFAII